MLNIFLKTFKMSVFYTKNQFTLFIKFVNMGLLINIVYFSLLLDVFLNTKSTGFLFCSFLHSTFLSISLHNYYVFMGMVLILSVFNLFIQLYKSYSSSKGNGASNNQYGLNEYYLISHYYFFQSSLSYVNAEYVLSKLQLFFKLLISNTILKFIYSLTQTSQISWFPIFKRHSIFGHYRISRQKWVELKTEEVNFLKY